jgi:hypothetical protein
MSGTPEKPRKLFREEAQTGNVDCLSCGGPIQLHGFGGTTLISCPYCGSTLSPDDSGELELAQRASRQQRESALPIYARGILDGIECEIIGIVWRETVIDGVAYPWQEFLVFNPYEGYRWLIQSEGAWSIAETLAGAPVTKHSAHRSVEFDGELYRHFQSSNATVTYVEGEFPWQIQVGDRAQVRDYIKPPHGISVEMTQGADGEDIVFSGVRHLDTDAVWSAFTPSKPPPSAHGVSMLAPNPHREAGKTLWRMFGVLMIVWTAVTALYVLGRDHEAVLALESPAPGAQLSTVNIGKEGATGTLGVRLEAPGMSNGYVYADISMVHRASGKETRFGLQADSWNDNPAKLKLGGIPMGEHTIKVDMKYDRKLLSSLPKTTLLIERDVALLRYSVFSFLIILFFPLFNVIRMGTFEARRWANSDYAHSD